MSGESALQIDQRWADLVASSNGWRHGHEDQASPVNDGAEDSSVEYCASPTPRSVSSGDTSMDNHGENGTPPESLRASVPLDQLSLNETSLNSSWDRLPTVARGGMLGAANASTRPLTGEVVRVRARTSPVREFGPHSAGIRKPVSYAHQAQTKHARHKTANANGVKVSSKPAAVKPDPHPGSRTSSGHIGPLSKVDSGYGSLEPSRQNTMPQRNLTGRETCLIPLSRRQSYPGCILEPDSAPISPEQLQPEIQGIHHGLSMVENKCISIDCAQLALPHIDLKDEQWNALHALHRTLLYEHHDFMMATQHPSATPMLRALATKHGMPARMWKHGIHAYLEVLRRGRPTSQPYMLSFLYLAYQMIALLYETVPIFLDTWIECLGDLARYRMAIEQDRETHAHWGSVAARWYTRAADRFPQTGRLNHHLGILERPSLRKFAFYAKSLTCVVPFPNTRDSLTTLCAPMVQEEQIIQNSIQSAEARVVTFHALIRLNKPYDDLAGFGMSAVELLLDLPSIRIRDIGVSLAVTNIANLFDLGNVQNPLWQTYGNVYKQSVEHTRPSMAAKSTLSNAPVLGQQVHEIATVPDPHFELRKTFCYSCANSLIRGSDDIAELHHVLPFAHVMLSWLHSLFTVQSRLADTDTPFLDTIGSLLNGDSFSWGGLAAFLNSLLLHKRVPERIIDSARNGGFLMPDDRPEAFKMPLSEDYMIRGLLWSQFYFPVDWFDGATDDDDDRHIDRDGEMTKARLERVLWLGFFFAFQTNHLEYHVTKHIFTAPVAGPSPLTRKRTPMAEPNSRPVSQASYRTSPAASATSEKSAEDGFTLVNHASKRQSKHPPLRVSPKQSTKKGRPDPKIKTEDDMGRSSRVVKNPRRDIEVEVKIQQDGGMEWEMT